LFHDDVAALILCAAVPVCCRCQLFPVHSRRSGVFCMKRFQALLTATLLLLGCLAHGETQLRFCLRSDPKTFNPLLVQEDSSDTIRYLTGGVLVRLNRQTQLLEPQLASSWKVSKDGRTITFTLRGGIKFSDGTPFFADDVAYTVQQMMDPALHSPTGDSFRSGEGKVETRVDSPTKISITFPAPIAGLDKLFDQ